MLLFGSLARAAGQRLMSCWSGQRLSPLGPADVVRDQSGTVPRVTEPAPPLVACRTGRVKLRMA